MTIKLHDKQFDKKEKEIINALSVLDEMGMNISRASQQLKITRPTLIKYRDCYWNKYLEVKGMITTDLGINNTEVETAIVLSATEKKVSDLFDKITSRIDIILGDPKLLKKVSFNSLIYAANVLLPYIQAKKEVSSNQDITDKQSDTVLNKIKKAMTEKSKMQINIQNNIQNNYNNKQNDTIEDNI